MNAPSSLPATTGARRPARKWGLGLAVGIALVLSLLALNRYSRTNFTDAVSPIAWDGSGYFVFLPGWVAQPHYMGTEGVAAWRTPDISNYSIDSTRQRLLSKYPVGRALLDLPAYWAMHHAWQLIAPAPRAGFEPPYQITVIVMSICWGVLGGHLLYCWLLAFLPPQWAVVGVLAVVFGTQAYWYMVYKPSYAHGVGFAGVSALLWATHQTYSTRQGLWLVALAALCSFLVLLRPSNFVFPLIPMAYGWALRPLFGHAIKPLGSTLLQIPRWPVWLALALLVAALLWVPQLHYWHWQSGSLVTYSYTGERFFFGNPQIAQYLFSPLNGLFAYHPIWFLCFGAMGWQLAGSYRRWGLLVLGVAGIAIYFNSSWWCWWFGGSLGQRSFTEMAALGALPLGLMLQRMGRRGRWIVGVLLLLLVYKNIAYGTYAHDFVSAEAAASHWWEK